MFYQLLLRPFCEVLGVFLKVLIFLVEYVKIELESEKICASVTHNGNYTKQERGIENGDV